MDYEKKYNEALSQARFYYGNCPTEPEKKKLEKLFPELRESKDERIRKWIIEELEITRDAMSGKNPYSDDPDIVARLKRLDEAIAYLKKQKEPENTSASTVIPSCWAEELSLQKEQKPAEWSEEDKRAIDRACVALRAYSNGDLPEFLPSELLGYADRLQSLRPQPHWKPSEEQLNALNFAITYFMHETNYKNPTELRDLYEQLKKTLI